MPVPGVVTFDDLRAISRLGERSTIAIVERWAKRAGIRYGYDGRGGIWTTLDALNEALGVKAPVAVDDWMLSPDLAG